MHRSRAVTVWQALGTTAAALVTSAALALPAPDAADATAPGPARTRPRPRPHRELHHLAAGRDRRRSSRCAARPGCTACTGPALSACAGARRAASTTSASSAPSTAPRSPPCSASAENNSGAPCAPVSEPFLRNVRVHGVTGKLYGACLGSCAAGRSRPDLDPPRHGLRGEVGQRAEARAAQLRPPPASGGADPGPRRRAGHPGPLRPAALLAQPLLAQPLLAQPQHVGDDLVAGAGRPRSGSTPGGTARPTGPPRASSIAITTPSGVTAVTVNPPLTCVRARVQRVVPAGGELRGQPGEQRSAARAPGPCPACRARARPAGPARRPRARPWPAGPGTPRTPAAPASSSSVSSASQPKSDGRPGPGESTTRSGRYSSSSAGGSRPAAWSPPRPCWRK